MVEAAVQVLVLAMEGGWPAGADAGGLGEGVAAAVAPHWAAAPGPVVVLRVLAGGAGLPGMDWEMVAAKQVADPSAAPPFAAVSTAHSAPASSAAAVFGAGLV